MGTGIKGDGSYAAKLMELVDKKFAASNELHSFLRDTKTGRNMNDEATRYAISQLEGSTNLDTASMSYIKDYKRVVDQKIEGASNSKSKTMNQSHKVAISQGNLVILSSDDINPSSARLLIYGPLHFRSWEDYLKKEVTLELKEKECMAIFNPDVATALFDALRQSSGEGRSLQFQPTVNIKLFSEESFEGCLTDFIYDKLTLKEIFNSNIVKTY